MALSDKKILTSERNAVYVKSNVGSRLTGTTEQNKDAFDKFPQLIMDKYNELIDLLTALGLDSIDTDLSSRYTKTETDTAIATETNDLVETITYTADDGKFTITTKGGTSTTIDTNIEKIPASFELVEEDGKTYLKITNDDGSTSKTDVSSLVNIYSFSDSDTIDFTENSGQVTAVVKNNSITIDHLSLAAISTIEGYVSSAAESATAAAASATSAETSADNASTFMNSAEEHSKAANEAKTASQTAATTATEQSSVANQKAAQAENSRLLAQSYAVGGTGTRPGEDTDNAQYYAQQASAVVGGDFISKVTSPTAGNIPKLTSNGQLEDSGVGIDELQEKELPTVSASDSGKVLTVKDDGSWAAAESKHVFVATANKTTFAEIETAYNAGQPIVCIDDYGVVYSLGLVDSAGFAFSSIMNEGKYWVANTWVVTANDTWRSYQNVFSYTVDESDVGKILQVDSYGYWAAAELTKEYTATTTTTWTDATGYYTQAVPVTGLLATDNPIVDLVTTTSGFEAEQAAWGKVFKVTTAANSITLYASEAITTELNLQIKVVR